MLSRRELLRRAALYTPLAYAALHRPRVAYGANIVAASASQSSVQGAVNAAADGDTVLIPNGSASWTSGIRTTKQILIRAQNYTPTSGGTMTRNVTITNSSTSGPLLEMQSGNSFHVGVGGIRFNEGSGNQNHVRMTGSGNKIPLIFDCAFQVKDRSGNQPDIGAMSLLSQGGVFWNCYVSGEGFSSPPPFPVGSGNASIYVHSPRAWTTPSTMGSLDVGGLVNWYLEDSNFYIVGQCPDIDDNARTVIRYSTLNGVFGVTHGFTSMWGGRHGEYYNNQILNTVANRNYGYPIWCRGGTVLMTENFVSDQNQGYGTPSALHIGDNTSPQGSYLIPRQPGCGHNGSNYVSDPIYIWNQTGGSAYDWGFNNSPGGWQSYVVEGRNIFVNAGPKPGYSKFTYPHPARAAVEGGTTASSPNPPSNLQLN
jgi:hypothetical protein